MEDNIKKIREACIVANPSIKDLVFGCFFMGREQMGEPFDEPLLFENWKEKNKTIRCLARLDNQCAWNVDDIQIIGRPIRLADVLLAIAKIEPQTMEGWTTSIHKIAYLSPTNWNLTLDDLTQQSPETISFIAELLSSN